MISRVYEFGDFWVNCSTRRLLNGTKPVALTPKAFDLLLVLIEHREQPLQAKDLIALVWDEERVTHNNFGVTLNAVRHALGETAKEPRFVVRFSAGYQFVGHVSELDYEVLDVESKGANQTPPKTLLNFPLGTLRGYAAHLMFGFSLYVMMFTVALGSRSSLSIR